MILGFFIGAKYRHALKRVRIQNCLTTSSGNTTAYACASLAYSVKEPIGLSAGQFSRVKIRQTAGKSHT
jgi:hypothetical protein